MNDIKLLLRLELCDLFGLNRCRHTRDPREKRRTRLLLGVCLFLIVLACGYVFGLTAGLVMLGSAHVVPAYLAFLASVLIVALGFFRAGPAIFRSHGYEMLVAMPLRPRAIVLARFAALYVEDLLLTLLILIPGTFTWGIFARPGLAACLTVAIGALFLPAIPLVLSTLFGTLVMAVSARSRHKSLVQTALMVAVLFAVLGGSIFFGTRAEEMSIEMIRALVADIDRLIATVYPPAAWLGIAAWEGSAVWLWALVGVSVGAMAVAVAIVAAGFVRIMRRLSVTSARHSYRLTSLQGRGLLKALYLREAKRYFSSSIYVTNTIVGPIMGIIASVALLVIGPQAVTAALPAELGLDLLGVLPFAFAAIFTMMTTTACAISMEGDRFWIVRSLPILAKTLFDSKILLGLTLCAPCYMLSQILLTVALRPAPLDLLFQWLIPAVTILFAYVLGISVDLCFHRLDWRQEAAVVKQGASAVLGGFAGPLVSLLLGGATLLTPASYAVLTKTAATVLLLLVTGLLYRRQGRARLEKL